MNTELNFGLRKDRVDRLGEARKTIHTSNQDVLQPSIIQVRQHRKPEVCTFGFRQIQAKNFLPTFKIKAQNRVNRLGCIAPVLLDLVVNRIEPPSR